jgi:hypothetical protein
VHADPVPGDDHSAYLITSWLGVLNTYLGIALPLLSTIICIFIFKASFEAVPRSLIDAARVDGLSEWRIVMRIMLPLSKSAIATNVILTFIWSWNAFPLAADRDPHARDADPAARPGALPVGDGGHDRRPLRLRRHGAGARPRDLPDGAKEFIRGLTSGATKG